jgi:formylglycine-generating enzyme required for sulfatase activity
MQRQLARAGIVGPAPSRGARWGLLVGGVLAFAACAKGIDPPAGSTVVRVEGGVFEMGGTTFDPCLKSSVGKNRKFTISCNAEQQSEALAHPVEVKDFYLDATEVNVEQYRHCVARGECTRPDSTEAGTREGRIRDYYGNSTYHAYPVLGTSHTQAQKYCAWKGGRLPTEAEWEFAASSRGTRDTVWENRDLVDNCAEPTDEVGFGKCSGKKVRPVGESSGDRTAQDIFDLGANATEWVADEFDYLAYCAKSQPNGEPRTLYTDGSERAFPQPEGSGVPSGLLATSAECLDVSEAGRDKEYAGGCDDRQEKCLGICATVFDTALNQTTEERQREWVRIQCDARAGRLPNDTATCADGAATVCAGLADEALAACESRCTCETTLTAPIDGILCVDGCLEDYRACATEGVAAGVEAERSACTVPDVLVACYDTDPDARGERLRARPVCLARGTADEPFKAYDGDRNVPHESGITQGDLAGGHVARGAHFQEEDPCEARLTRRRLIQKTFVSSHVGFRCAYDQDPSKP